MSVLLQARGLACSINGRELFAGLDLAVHAGERLALVGHNGCGKTTLLDLLSGARTADAGDLQRRRGLVLSRVEQFLPPTLGTSTLQDAVAQCGPVGEGWRAERILARFGFDPVQCAQAVASLSGGQQNRLMFARALVSEPDLLLLDEPTNHLDLATLVVFEQVLDEFPGALVLVSHDREFLDSVTRQTLFLRDGRLYRFELPYSAARQALAEMDEASVRARRAEEAQIDRVQQSARRLAEWGRIYDSEKFARRARSMQRRISRMEAEKTFVSEGSPLNLSLNLAATRSRQALLIENLEVVVAGRALFRIDELLIRPGERVGLLGHNGVGKSTFIRALAEAQTGGDERIRFSPQTVLGYYDQELDEVRGDEGLVDFAVRRTGRDEQAVRHALIHAGFPYPDHDKPVGVLSGGERARMLFLVLSLNAPNFLVMDEPTNHIDIDGKEALEAQLLAGDATLLITSHDRRFLTNVAERYLWVRDGALVELIDPEAFFRSAAVAPVDTRRKPGAPETPGAQPPGDADEGHLLARIIELEELLEADRARKPRQQKPARQAAWQRELDALYRRLE